MIHLIFQTNLKTNKTIVLKTLEYNATVIENRLRSLGYKGEIPINPSSFYGNAAYGGVTYKLGVAELTELHVGDEENPVESTVIKLIDGNWKNVITHSDDPAPEIIIPPKKYDIAEFKEVFTDVEYRDYLIEVEKTVAARHVGITRWMDRISDPSFREFELTSPKVSAFLDILVELSIIDSVRKTAILAL